MWRLSVNPDKLIIGAGNLETLSNARIANPQWFEAIVLAAEVMAQRRKKWSGQTGPYTNFIRYSQQLGIDVQESFRHMQALKFTRDSGSEALDDSLLDNDVDKTNYAALAAGWRLLSPVAKMAAMLELGPWIDSSLLKDWSVVDGPQN
jgi:hypothetical protein